jgi:glyoxylase-like metal-dependent hydrolase (beta-lactamase superfamily II)
MLGHITPNALVMIDHKEDLPIRRSQEEFYASLAKVENLNPDIVHPAHGQPITDYRKTIELYRTCYRKRSEAIMAELASGEQTIYPMARRLFPELGGIRLPLEIFLAISEVYSHLQILELENRIEWWNNGRRVIVRAK